MDAAKVKNRDYSKRDHPVQINREGHNDGHFGGNFGRERHHSEHQLGVALGKWSDSRKKKKMTCDQDDDDDESREETQHSRVRKMVWIAWKAEKIAVVFYHMVYFRPQIVLYYVCKSI